MKLPDSYEAWRQCITVACGVPLTPSYVEARAAGLKDPDATETKRFAELYGEAHLARVLSYFERSRRELVADEP